MTISWGYEIVGLDDLITSNTSVFWALVKKISGCKPCYHFGYLEEEVRD